MPRDPFHPHAKIKELSERLLASSVADETELVWFERRHGAASNPPQERDFLEKPRLTILVRVVDGKRIGWHRAETADFNLLESGVRQALAVSRVQPSVKRLPVMPTSNESLPPQSLADLKITTLEPTQARTLVKRWCGQRSRGTLSWSVTQVAVFNSHGLRRRADTTAATLEVAWDDHQAGAGLAAASSRSLAGLAAEEIVHRAQQRCHPGPLATLPEGPISAVLAPEAVIEMLNALNMLALSGRAFLDGSSFLTRHRGEQVFHRSIHLEDDGTNPHGVPFPFDLEGSPKTPLALIVDGRPFTPALDRNQGAETGLKSTAQAVGGGDSLFGNLFMAGGDTSEEDLLATAEGGIYISHLDPPECFDLPHLLLRTRARGVRRITDGRLGAPLPDLVWEESLLTAFARLHAIGNQPVVRIVSSTPMGAISAPAVSLMESQGFTTAK